MGRDVFRRWAGLGAALILAGSVAGCGSAAEVNGLERLQRQQLRWQPCGDEKLDAAGAECADVTVPLNYAEPQGRTITVAISRARAADSARRHGVLISNPGGPGASGLDTALLEDEIQSGGLRERYDLIGMDPRGIGRSTPMHCDWPTPSGLRAAGLDRAGFEKTLALHADLAARCRETGDAYRYITTRNTARDMDLIRAVLGEQRISYIGTSYGTYLGSVFAQMFPDRIDRLVLDSAIDPVRYSVGMIQQMGKPNEVAFDVWAGWVAARDGEYHLGATASAVRAKITELLRRSAREPITVGAQRVEAHELPLILFEGVAGSQGYVSLAVQLRQLLDAAEGRAQAPDSELEQTLRDEWGPGSDSAVEMMIQCGDAPAPRDPDWYWRNLEASRATEPLFGSYANHPSVCAFWPAPVEPPTVIGNALPSLILQSVMDTRTAYEEGIALHGMMTGSRLVTMPDKVAHGVLDKSACARAVAAGYLRTGVLPEADMTCAAG
ncbi:alpha/beta fold hydrolase [Nocardia panacis]|uniref:Alpha/beta fold hydrolase n=1 Tax=Nocardia panacis TaxID=2340916 RepID=A0A3A4K2Q2_9NOCA|nr:alpha/beta hydrolase [Nocardia panacis]RJO68276.1 alpha/beta fold hydrolase [Nocardia panacis]